jgi:chitinase
MHLWRGVLACLVVLAAAGSSVAPVAGRTTRDARVIIGYVFPHGRVLAAGEIDATNLTHVNYAFANVVGGEVVEGSPLDAENFRVLAGLRRVHPHLRVLVSVGGWTWSKGFSDAALTADSRRRFVDSAVAFVRRHALDGVDIDWEYPALPGDSNPHRPEDTANFTQLMAALRASLDAEGVASSRQLLLTMAAGAFPAFLAHADMDAVQRTVDFVNLMTYDFRVQSADRTTGHHANLRLHPDDDKQLSVERAVRDFGRRVFPPPKSSLACRSTAGRGNRSPPRAAASTSPGSLSRRRSICRRPASTRSSRRIETGCAGGTSRRRHRTSGTRTGASSRAWRTSDQFG